MDRIAVKNDLKDLRKQMKGIELKNIYNMDETSLFWKLLPDNTLTHDTIAGGKAQKTRITAVFCCNAIGTRKMKPWFIGKAQTPRCFGS